MVTQEKVYSQQSHNQRTWRYTNAPDEDRAIQAVWANKWGVGDASISSLAGKMGDQTEITCSINTIKLWVAKQNSPTTGYECSLDVWYTSWVVLLMVLDMANRC